ncbi:hypothetical protein [Paenibacillus sp. NFR01]|uniref:hypothetical protein n=1 Tax=Paenibacillus sp. NFR01 TaxID=1566279 RepID=UPI0008B8309D|nr:hypothetical protein [Paenibacillus sp. NFR01]SET40463.1 hypothetical protein SAMN03159358_1581 [Paenibacillus sp. NFR01]
MKKRVRKKLHKKYLVDIVYEMSISSSLRKKLFNGSNKLTVDSNNLHDVLSYIKQRIKRYDLRYYVSVVPHSETVGWEDWGDDQVYFKFESVEFPYINLFSANNPNVI